MKNDDTLANLKNLKLSDSELRFLKDYRRLEDHFLDESWLSQTSLLSDKSCWMDHRRDLYVAE